MQANRRSSLTAGLAIVLMAVAAAFTFGYAHNTLIIPGDAPTTVSNLRTMSSLFTTEIFGWLIILFLDITASIALYSYFKNENQKVARAMGALRLVYSAILGFGIFNLIKINNIFNSSANTISETLQTKVMHSLNVFQSAWSMGLIIFGFHLLLLGYLVYKSYNIHRFWGVLLIIAAVSYIIVHTTKNFIPGSEHFVSIAETVLGLPMAIGEVGFAVWLIVRGKQPKIVFRNKSNELKPEPKIQLS